MRQVTIEPFDDTPESAKKSCPRIGTISALAVLRHPINLEEPREITAVVQAVEFSELLRLTVVGTERIALRVAFPGQGRTKQRFWRPATNMQRRKKVVARYLSAAEF